MMKNTFKIKIKKLKFTTGGFTLIELLAVIIILGVIALITVPLVLRLINNSRKKSAIFSANEYVNQTKSAILVSPKKTALKDAVCIVNEENAEIIICNGEILELSTEGKRPICGKVVYENYNLKSYELNISGYKVVKNSAKEEETSEKTTICGIYEYYDTNNNSNNTNTNTNNNSNTQTTNQPTIPSYIGYYADVNSDGSPDGVIYADMAFTKNYSSAAFSFYYSAKSNLSEYVVSNETYSGNFGNRKMLSKKPGSSGTSRFYVMSLWDFNPGTKYAWYYNASYTKGNTKYNNLSASIVSVSFGTGKENTRKLINKWNTATNITQSDLDIWKYIQGEYSKGWYVPSRDEWSAFVVNLGLTRTSTYTARKLASSYWSSSLISYSVLFAYKLCDRYGDMSMCSSVIDGYESVRLGYTF